LTVRAVRLGIGVITAGLVIAGCNLSSDTGYVEIKTVPATARAPTLYLDGVKLDTVQKGSAVLQQGAGTAKLSAEAFGGSVALCEIAVRKNRITTVTISVLDRPPRCQCRNTGPDKACVS
jgi:hypothetical protein